MIPSVCFERPLSAPAAAPWDFVLLQRLDIVQQAGEDPRKALRKVSKSVGIPILM